LETVASNSQFVVKRVTFFYPVRNFMGSNILLKHIKKLTYLVQLALTFLGASSISLASESVAKEALAAHNKFRALHHAPPLVWDNTLANYALRYASQCQFQHSSGSYGENLAAGYPSITEAVTAWHAEGDQYPYDKPGFYTSTGHFTQMVWKGSKKVGCGYVNCNGKNGIQEFLVCEYSPAGNIVNEGFFKANVLPPK
jgi:uncharacterized protein YkwD